MAYASVASLLETIDLVNYHGDSSISSRFKDQITSLHEHTSFLQSFLEDGDPNRAKNWEETIRDVTDRAEEIIDLLVSDSLLKLKSCFGSKSELDYSFDELDKVTEEMESTANRVKGRGTKANAAPDAELMDIISLLREGSPNREKISIVGMGGMGKSTLARNAYNHPLVTEHFELRAWSTVGPEYSRKGVFSDLLRCINIDGASNRSGESIENLYRSLMGWRYLIVLHDMWCVRAWDGVKYALPDEGNGSRIIVTTRLLNLANSGGHVHEMRLLDEDGAWNLLRGKIFKGDPCPSRLEQYGKIISYGCRGHLLPIEVVSGILAADQTEAVWEDVSEYIKSVSDIDHALTRVLSLSYTYLPHQLRPCFLYLGCFPEDHEIRVSRLIKLWVAEGFLNESDSKSFEEIGEEHVEDLVRRSLVSVSKRKCNGRIKSITVHGLVRDLCLKEAHMGNFFHDVGRHGLSESCRRVCSSNNCGDFLKGAYDSTIRTAILYHGEVGLRRSIGNARLLRILNLSNAYGYELPEEVFELFHLRYLAFHSWFSLSEAISNLQNLQTLIIFPREDGGVFDNMPEGIWRMPRLRHLLNFAFKLPTLKLEGEGESSAIENLETLSKVVDFVCSRENLRMIPNVKKLSLVYIKKSSDVVGKYELHNLIYLQRLETLKIEIQWSSLVRKHEMSFAFPPMLKKLNLCSLQLPWEDMKIVGSLPNLEVFKLRNHACLGDTWEMSEGGFSRLMYLMIEGSDLENWITKSYHFPKLKSLVLRLCLHLSRVPREVGEIPTLELMELDRGNQSLVDSAKRILEDRQSLGDDLLRVLVLD